MVATTRIWFLAITEWSLSLARPLCRLSYPKDNFIYPVNIYRVVVCPKQYSVQTSITVCIINRQKLMSDQSIKFRKLTANYIWHFKYFTRLTCLVTRMSDPTWISPVVNVLYLPPHCKYVNGISWHFDNFYIELQVHDSNIFPISVR